MGHEQKDKSPNFTQALQTIPVPIQKRREYSHHQCQRRNLFVCVLATIHQQVSSHSLYSFVCCTDLTSSFYVLLGALMLAVVRSAGQGIWVPPHGATVAQGGTTMAPHGATGVPLYHLVCRPYNSQQNYTQ